MQTDFGNGFLLPTPHTTVEGFVAEIIPLCSLRHHRRCTEITRRFLVTKTSTKSLDSPMWCFKFSVWGEWAENLNVEVNKVYRFTNYELGVFNNPTPPYPRVCMFFCVINNTFIYCGDHHRSKLIEKTNCVFVFYFVFFYKFVCV